MAGAVGGVSVSGGVVVSFQPTFSPMMTLTVTMLIVRYIYTMSIVKCFGAVSSCSQIFTFPFCFTHNENDTDDKLAQQESNTNTMEQALSAPVIIPFGLPHRDEAGWRWNADKEEIQTQSIWRQH